MAEGLIQECQDAGLAQGATDYLVARGFKKLAQIANVADELGEFMTAAFKPFKDGMEIGKGEEKKVWKMAEGEDELVVITGFKCLWKRAKMVEKAEEEKAPQTPPVPFPPPVPTVQVIQAPETNKDKAPKKLGQGVWLKQIGLYEDAQSPPRPFPQKLIAGADEVLARMLWEHEVSKVYSELGLGEIIGVRMYDSCGQVNKYRNKNKGKDVLAFRSIGGEEMEVVKKEGTGWNPKSGDLIRDALEANKWAYIFAGYAVELVADKWVDQFRQNLRAKNEPERCRDLYEAATMKLTLEMLSGYSFQEATEWIISDRSWWTEFNQDWRAPPMKRKWSGKGQDRAWKGERVRPGFAGARPKGKGKTQRTCHAYNSGWCTRSKAECHFSHSCSNCGGSHKACDNACPTYGGKNGQKDKKDKMNYFGKGRGDYRKRGKGGGKR